MLRVTIVENSWIAKLAAKKLSVQKCAIVIGASIHLCKISKTEFLQNETLKRHEICHVYQWKRNTYIYFLFHYLYLSVRFGYYQNPYELEAREAESNTEILRDIHFE